MTYALLSILTQVKLVVYILIWAAFTCTITYNGIMCICSQFFGNNNKVNDSNEENNEKEEENKDEDKEEVP